MSTSEALKTSQASLSRDLLYAARYYLGSRRGLIIVAFAALVGGLALNWSWLVAAGIAPLLLTALPCVAMCALGLCMNKMGEKSCSTSTKALPDTSLPESDGSKPLQRTAADDAQGVVDRPPVTASLGAPSETADPLSVETSTRRSNDA